METDQHCSEAKVTQKRITADEVLSALTAIETNTGVSLQLKRAFFGDGITCGCPETILYIAAGGKFQNSAPCTISNNVDEWVIKTYGDAYGSGFRHGFDNGYVPNEYTVTRKDHCSEAEVKHLGRLDGAAVYDALKDRVINKIGGHVTFND